MLSREMTRLIIDPSLFLLIIFVGTEGFYYCHYFCKHTCSDKMHQQCISTVITGRSKNGCETCIFQVQPPPTCRASLQAPGTLMLTVCLQMCICVCFKLPPVAGDLTDRLWLCLGSCLRQHCCTVYKPGPWESPGEADMMIKVQFSRFISLPWRVLGVILLWEVQEVTDIAKEETLVQNMGTSMLTMTLPGCSWMSSESGSSQQLALNSFSWISTLLRPLPLPLYLFTLVFPAKLTHRGGMGTSVCTYYGLVTRYRDFQTLCVS